MTKKLQIEGMTCGHCVKHATGALEEINGVTSVNVTLKPGSATVECQDTVTNDMLTAAIEEVGYKVTSIEG